MKIRFKQNKHLDRLEKLLNVKVDSAMPSATYLFPDTLGSIGIAASIFATPVILWSLFRLKKYGWLIGFAVAVILPGWLAYQLIDNVLFLSVVALFPLFFMVLYYVILKHKINDWREPIFINKPGSDYK